MSPVLRCKRSGEIVGPGFTTTDFRGDPCRVADTFLPHKAASTGRVELVWLDANLQPTAAKGLYFPGVIDARWSEADEVALTGPDWDPTPETLWYASQVVQGVNRHAFGPTPDDAMQNLVDALEALGG